MARTRRDGPEGRSSGSDDGSALPAERPGRRRSEGKLAKHDRQRGDGAEASAGPFFLERGRDVLEATLAGSEGGRPLDRVAASVRHAILGRPLSSREEAAERLPRWKALAVFSSDAMSSVAYATEACLFTLLAAGRGAFGLLVPISLLIVAVLLVVTAGYRQVIRAYPGGGGGYVVARTSFGDLAGLVAAAALLVDYVLTVAVSMSSGILNLASAFPALRGLVVPLIVAAILAVMLVNLRGARETGSLFALPTYLFLALMLLTIGVGGLRTILGGAPHVSGVVPAVVAPEALGALLVMRAFADGCSAMTGVEAISNGTPAFQKPEPDNARSTMLVMALLLATMFLGVSFLALATGATPSLDETIVSQIGRATFGTGPVYYVLQVATMAILLLAANTSFAGFPRLASILARDGFFPRQFAYLGERLAFNVGIVVLALISIAVAVAFRGRVEALIPLYAIGVFTSFTLSQAGMVRHWLRDRGEGWRGGAAINGLGAVVTGIVTAVFAIAKFALGAWIIVVLVPLLVLAMRFVHGEYAAERASLEVHARGRIPPPHRRQRIVVAATGLNRAVIEAIRVGQTMPGELRVVHVTTSLEDGRRFRERLRRLEPDVEVVLVESPYRELVDPFVHEVEALESADPEAVTVVLVPEYVPRHWWDRLLFNRNAKRIRDGLLGHRNVVVLDVPYRRPGESPDGAGGSAG